jgi:hypothetical protein
MTDRYRALIVMLDKPTREDDCEQYVTACRMMRGVTAVHLVAGSDGDIGHAAARLDHAQAAIRFHQEQISQLVKDALTP